MSISNVCETVQQVWAHQEHEYIHLELTVIGSYLDPLIHPWGQLLEVLCIDKKYSMRTGAEELEEVDRCEAVVVALWFQETIPRPWCNRPRKGVMQLGYAMRTMSYGASWGDSWVSEQEDKSRADYTGILLMQYGKNNVDRFELNE